MGCNEKPSVEGKSSFVSLWKLFLISKVKENIFESNASKFVKLRVLDADKLHIGQKRIYH